MKAPQAFAIRPLSDHKSQLSSSVDFTERGKPENPTNNPRRTEETNHIQQLYSHKFQLVRESTRGYSQVITHPSTNPVRPGLTSEQSGERQRANYSTRHPSMRMRYVHASPTCSSRLQDCFSRSEGNSQRVNLPE